MNMSILTSANPSNEMLVPTSFKNGQFRVVDLLKCLLLILIALNYIYDYFHYDAFTYESTYSEHTTVGVLITKWIALYCVPVFIFLTGISAFIYGREKTRKEFSRYLLRRGLLLVIAEFLISSLANRINPSFPFFNLQALWCCGVSMIVLSAMVYMSRLAILLTGVLIIIGYNSLYMVQPGGQDLRAMLNLTDEFVMGHFSFSIHSQVLPCIGMIAIGYYFGNLYLPGYHPEIRKTTLLCLGIGALAIFFSLRISDPSGAASQWYEQNNAALGILFFLDVTDHPPSILYTLITLGPTMIFLAAVENPWNRIARKIAIEG